MSSGANRQQRADINGNLGHALVDQAPDSRPAVRLRQELARDRRLGYSFDAVFKDEVEWAVAGLGPTEANGWREALLATEAAWCSGYERSTPNVSSLHSGLLIDAA